MTGPTRIKRIGRWVIPALLLTIGLVRASDAITVSTEMSATSLRATDTLTVRVFARWPGGEELYRFATPRPSANTALRLTGQSTGGSTFLENDEFVSEKAWRFDFVCVQPGSTQVVPPVIVYTYTISGATDSVAGAPMLLAIGPPPPPPFDYSQLLLYLAVIIAVGAVLFFAVRVLRRHRQLARQKALHKTPEEQTTKLLEELRASKREDRCEQFYTALEKIVLGLWEARVGRRLTGKTPQEVASVLRESGIAEGEAVQVQEVLTDCHTVRFGGGKVPLQAMEISFGTVTSWVKPRVDS